MVSPKLMHSFERPSPAVETSSFQQIFCLKAKAELA